MANQKKYCNRLGILGWISGGSWGIERYLYILHRVTGIGILFYFLLHVFVTTSRAFGQAKWDKLPRYCQECGVRAMCNGECPKNRFLPTPDGEAGLNYLCAGYKRFFTHCQSFVAEVAAQWRQQSQKQPLLQEQDTRIRTSPKPGRNDPCPCGSGLKYKKCCLGK